MTKHALDIWSPQLRNRRQIDVYLPPSYDSEPRRRYPVVYMHDGQNLSDPFTAFGGTTWRLEGALERLASRGLETIVVGVHNTMHGENVRAYVTVREGAAQPSSAEVILFCRDRVGYKAPEEIIFLDEIPLNPTGKIDRFGLKRMAEDHLHPHLTTQR